MYRVLLDTPFSFPVSRSHCSQHWFCNTWPSLEIFLTDQSCLERETWLVIMCAKKVEVSVRSLYSLLSANVQTMYCTMRQCGHICRLDLGERQLCAFGAQDQRPHRSSRHGALPFPLHTFPLNYERKKHVIQTILSIIQTTRCIYYICSNSSPFHRE